MLCDGYGRVLRVARDHGNLDATGMQLADGLVHALARRIYNAHKTHKGKRVELRPIRHCDDTQAALCHLCGGIEEALAVLGVEGDVVGAVVEHCAPLHNRFNRALDVKELLVGSAFARAAADGHPLLVRVERQLKRALIHPALIAEPHLERGGENRALCRLSQQLAVAQLRIRAEGPDLQHLSNVRVRREINRLSTQQHRSGCGISNTSNVARVLLTRCKDLRHRHFVLRQSARLVNANNTRRPQRLDARQLLHDCVALGHPHDAESERHRDDNGKSLGDCGNGKRHANGEHLEEIALLEEADDNNEPNDCKREDGQFFPELVHA
eukprot:Opistho-2@21594